MDVRPVIVSQIADLLQQVIVEPEIDGLGAGEVQIALISDQVNLLLVVHQKDRLGYLLVFEVVLDVFVVDFQGY